MNKISGLAFILILGGCAIASNLQVGVASKSVLANVRDAKVTRVDVTGTENSYTFAVTISSPDTGCDRFLNGAYAPVSRRDFAPFGCCVAL